MSTADQARSDGRSLTVQVAMTFRRCGGRKQVVTDDDAPVSASRSARIDSTLVKALARAYRWQAMLDSGAYASITELAVAERINPSYLARVLRLMLLAPEIAEAILDGRNALQQPALDTLMSPFSADWQAQRRLFLRAV